jgi:hypothetical protein
VLLRNHAATQSHISLVKKNMQKSSASIPSQSPKMNGSMPVDFLIVNLLAAPISSSGDHPLLVSADQPQG